jgi:hypothetical protein
MDAKLEAIETKASRMTPFLLTKCESNEDISHSTHSTDPISVDYSRNSSQGKLWTDDDNQTLNGLLSDDEDDQTLNSLLGDDEDFLQADQEDSPQRRSRLRTRLDKHIPSEIVAIQESPLSSFQERSVDMFTRLQDAEFVVHAYKERVQSAESYGDSLLKYLRKTQAFAEKLAIENQSLKYDIAEMKREQVMRKDTDLLFGTLIGACFVFYMFGSSEYYLAASLGMYLLFGAVSFFL